MAHEVVSGIFEFDTKPMGHPQIVASFLVKGSDKTALIDPGFPTSADHVIGSPGKKIEIISHSIGRVDAEVIAVDRAHDLALLRLSASTQPYPSLPSAQQMPRAASVG